MGTEKCMCSVCYKMSREETTLGAWTYVDNIKMGVREICMCEQNSPGL
jgi:hypothetical protein